MTTIRSLAVILGLTVSCLLAASAAAAQTPDDPPLSVAAAGGIAHQPYGELSFGTTPVWQVTVRGGRGHLAFEGLFEQWTHRDEHVYTNQLITGPDGPLGRVGRVDEQQHHRMRTLGVNVLGTGRAGRAIFAAGGGLGMMAYDKRFIQETSGCDAASASLCNRYQNEFSSSSVTAQLTAEAGAMITRRVGAFGRYDLVMPLREIGFGHSAFTAGVRVLVW